MSQTCRADRSGQTRVELSGVGPITGTQAAAAASTSGRSRRPGHWSGLVCVAVTVTNGATPGRKARDQGGCARSRRRVRRPSRRGDGVRSVSARRGSAAGSGLRHCTSDAPAASTASRPSRRPRRAVQRGQHPVGRAEVQRGRRGPGRGEHLGDRRPGQGRGRRRAPGDHGTNSSPCCRTSVAKSIDAGWAGRAGPCRTRPGTAPAHRRPARRPAPGRAGRRRRGPTRPRPGRPPRSAPHDQAASSTAAVCQCAGSSAATRVPGSTSHSSRSRLAALAAQFAVVTADSSMRSPVASS